MEAADHNSIFKLMNVIGFNYKKYVCLAGFLNKAFFMLTVAHFSSNNCRAQLYH